MKTSVALKIVKKHVAVDADGCANCWQDGAMQRYICHAAERATGRGGISHKASVKITKHIEGLLMPHSSLETWLDRGGFIDPGFRGNYGIRAYLNKMQATRHAWIDNMIKEFQSKGD